MNVHVLYRGFWARPVPALACQVVAIAACARFARPPQALLSARPVAAVALGLAGWTLFEYLLHRFAMHGPRRLWELLHKEHHQLRAMEEKDHFLLHPFVGVPAFALVAWAGAHLVPLPAMLGWWAGYVVYELFHFMHHHPGLTAWAARLPYLRHNVGLHVVHHLRHASRNYGVTTSLWDRVFGTYLSPLEAELPTAGAPHHRLISRSP